MDDCILCNLYEDKNALSCENEYFFAHFDKNPATPGHTIVIPKRHVLSLFDLTDAEWILLKPMLVQAVQAIEAVDKRALYEGLIARDPHSASRPYWEHMLRHVGLERKPDGYNFGNNDGEAAGRSINHLHIHVIPRYFGDVESPRGGVRHIIPGMGHTKDEIS